MSAARTEICIHNGTNLCTNCVIDISVNDMTESLEDNNTLEFRLCSKYLPLKDLIHIHDKVFVSISSDQQSNTIIDCMENDAGFKFVNISTLMLRNFKIHRCGATHNSTSLNTSDLEESDITTKQILENNLIFKSSIYILNCSDVSATYISVRQSIGTGMIIIDSNQFISIDSCTFEDNKAISDDIQGGGGLYIEFSYCNPGGLQCYCNINQHKRTQNSSYVISNCSFSDNQATTANEQATSYLRASEENFRGIGRGGGLCIHFRGTSSNNTIEVNNCNFDNNSAVWGGGVYITLYNSPVKTQNSSFTCTRYGGGGASNRFLFDNHQLPKGNRIKFYECKFTGNRAEYGGGTSIYSSKSYNYTILDNEMKFEKCTWTENTAIFGAAVNVGLHVWDTYERGFLPIPGFKDCTFLSNYIDKEKPDWYIQGRGIFFAVGFDLEFEGTTSFQDNNDTAIYLVSSQAKFLSSSQVCFINNQAAIDGGAIVLTGFASIAISDHSYFAFTNNIAHERGGAISQTSISINDYLASRSCFIQYCGNRDLNSRNVTFLFEGNTVKGDNGRNRTSNYLIGHSIFATTLRPCYASCTEKNIQYNETFDCIANFTFLDRVQYEISTKGEKIENTTNGMIFVIPGKTLMLPIDLVDEMHNSVDDLLHASIQDTNTNISVPSEYIYISNKQIQIHGNPNEEGILKIETTHIRKITYTMQVHINECPPGFTFNVQNRNGEKRKTCICSAMSGTLLYVGITRCNFEDYTAELIKGYWIGYESEGNESYGREANLILGYCPIGYCSNNQSSNVYTLPNNTNITKLDRLVCGENRTGIVCGKCRGDLSTHYHQSTFKCKTSKLCNIGFILYLASEIVPITIFFLIIITFDISLATGGIDGIVFYFQVTDVLAITNSFIDYPPIVYSLLQGYSFITGIFNLKFFNLDDLSFCLWKKAGTLDILAFKYITILYSLLLVGAIIGLLKICNIRKITRKLPKVCGRKIDVKNTIIHGLSGFFIICYSEGTRISLTLLTPVTLYSKDSSRNVLFYDGNMNFSFSSVEFLRYAIPAIFVFVFLGLIPPLLLIAYPLSYKIFSLCGMGESRFVKILCVILPLEKMKPLYDSIQYRFKDNYRFFSGLLFIYRLLALLTFTYNSSLTNYYTMTQVQFLIIFCLHAIIQPYKKGIHNILFALILLNLLVINAITLYIYRRAFELKDNRKLIRILSTIQILLLYLPIMYLIIIIGRKLFNKFKKVCGKKKANSTDVYELMQSFLFEDTRSS